jgi:hypothetical protein
MARFSAFIVVRGFRFPPRSTVTANRSSRHCQGFISICHSVCGGQGPLYRRSRLELGLRLSRGYQVLIHHVMARAYPIYEARAKVSEILRRVTAAETSPCHFRIIK